MLRHTCPLKRPRRSSVHSHSLSGATFNTHAATASASTACTPAARRSARSCSSMKILNFADSNSSIVQVFRLLYDPITNAAVAAAAERLAGWLAGCAAAIRLTHTRRPYIYRAFTCSRSATENKTRTRKFTPCTVPEIVDARDGSSTRPPRRSVVPFRHVPVYHRLADYRALNADRHGACRLRFRGMHIRHAVVSDAAMSTTDIVVHSPTCDRHRKRGVAHARVLPVAEKSLSRPLETHRKLYEKQQHD